MTPLDGATAGKTQSRLFGIDACRGLAAVLVVLHHAEVTVSKPKYFAADPFHGACLFGARGVDFFFVLSGFIITYAHWNDLGKSDRIMSYAYKRFIRIFPILWIVALPYMAINVFRTSEYVPRLASEKIEVVVTSLLLLPSRLPPMPRVVWTLKHEILFYSLFACAIWRPKLGVTGLAVWLLLCVAYALDGRYSNFVSDLCLSPYNIEFMLGVGCGAALRSSRVAQPSLLAVLGALLFCFAAASFEMITFSQPWITNGTSLGQVVQFGLASVLIVLGVGQTDLDGRTVVPQLFKLLGAASYVIYLIHFPVISICCKLLKGISTTVSVPPMVAAAVVVLAALASGIILHLWIEMPLMAMFRRSHSRQQAANFRAPSEQKMP